ncbi:MAG: hypothetical protein GQ574_12320 [Crocinitomix sp.]|nr:hypothetical protein [Crocinitomix sp.]
MNPKSSKKNVIIILCVTALLAVLFTEMTFYGEAKVLSTIIGAVLLGGIALIIIANIIKKYLPTKWGKWITNKLGVFIFFDYVAHELLENRVGIIISVVLLGLFAGMEQAQELLLHLSENKLGPPVFFGLLLLLALLNWYWVRFTYIANVKAIDWPNFLSQSFKMHLQEKDREVNHIRAILPKFIGLIIILIPTFFILILYLRNVGSDHDALAVVGTALFYWSLMIICYAFAKVSFYQVIKDLITKRKWILWTVLGVLVGFTVMLAAWNDTESPKKIPYLYLSGGVIAILYFLFASMEIEKILLKSFRLIQSKNRLNFAIFWGAIVTLCFFILFNFLPLLIPINGLSILLAGLVFYTFMAYMLIIIGGRNKLPVLTLIVVGGVISSIIVAPGSSLHDVRLSPKSQFNVQERATIDEYVAAWFEDHATDIQNYGQKYPIVFVSAEGGGSRAAFWTLMAHNAMEESVDNYYDHIFSLSGASGGNTGNSFYVAYHDVADETDNVAEMANEVFKNDFVSTDIGLLFGRDSWQSIVGSGRFYDRSEFLQQRWEDALSGYFNGNFNGDVNPLQREFLSFWYDQNNQLKFDHPLFLLHTTHVQTGDHATMSAVQLNNFIPQNMDLLERTDTILNKTIPLSSGALMNARFPLVCPSGKIPDVGNFVDAGYYDNFGAAETRAAMKSVIKFLADSSNNYNAADFEIVHLVFRNGLPNDETGEYMAVRSNRTAKGAKNEAYIPFSPVAEQLVPVIALSGAAFAHPNRELAEAEYLANTTFYFDLKRMEVDYGGERIKPILPLSRHLSDLARLSMEICIQDIMDTQMDDLLKLFAPKQPD